VGQAVVGPLPWVPGLGSADITSKIVRSGDQQRPTWRGMPPSTLKYRKIGGGTFLTTPWTLVTVVTNAPRTFVTSQERPDSGGRSWRGDVRDAYTGSVILSPFLPGPTCYQITNDYTNLYLLDFNIHFYFFIFVCNQICIHQKITPKSDSQAFSIRICR
jgi:hypothetical protein